MQVESHERQHLYVQDSEAGQGRELREREYDRMEPGQVCVALIDLTLAHTVKKRPDGGNETTVILIMELFYRLFRVGTVPTKDA